MYLQTKEIGSEGMTVDRRFDFALSAPREGDEPIRIGQVHLSGTLSKVADGISFMGDIETDATVMCSRCLDSFALPLELHFDLLYTTGPEVVEKKESRVDEESITHAQYDGARIDLGQLLEEQVYLGLPLKPLCQGDCHGLCPRCGTNLNLGACRCREEQAEDPRLLVLKTLL